MIWVNDNYTYRNLPSKRKTKFMLWKWWVGLFNAPKIHLNAETF